VDFGTSNTVALLRRVDGSATPLLFDSSPLLASGVFAGPEADLLTGADADRAAGAYPAGLEANPKRRIDDGTVWLGEREWPVVDLVAAVLTRVAAEARRVAGQIPSTVVLTHPATWSRTRLGVLADAARAAGLGEVGFVAEPVAAAAYFATAFGVVATDGLPDLGGLDLDAVVVDHARSLTAGATDAWGRLDWPETPADQRARRVLWHSAPTIIDQPELVVAEGSLHARATMLPASVGISPPPVEPDATPAPPAPSTTATPELSNESGARRAGRVRRVLVAAGAAILLTTIVIATVDRDRDPQESTPPASSSASPTANAPTATASSDTTAAKAAAERFLPRIPAEIRAMGCDASMTRRVSSVPYVSCGTYGGLEIIYYLHPSAAAMNANFQQNLSREAIASAGSCAISNARIVTTYTQGSHHGKITCHADFSQGYLGWTDESTLIYGLVPRTDVVSYSQMYTLWKTAVQVTPG
jgi:hypothetical protein